MEIIVLIFDSILCYFISVIIHELGHIIVGLINGWKFYLLVVGPIGIKADEKGRIKLYLEKNIALWGGVGGTLPCDANENNIKIWAKVLIGGPLSSIVTGIIFLPAGILIENIILILIGAMSLGIGIMCALPLPLKTGITYSDGKRWARLQKPGQEADEEISLFKLTENEITGGDFLNIDLKDIEPLVKSKETEIRYYGYYYEYKYYKARNNIDEMKLVINNMKVIKNKIPKIITEGCKVDLTKIEE